MNKQSKSQPKPRSKKRAPLTVSIIPTQLQILMPQKESKRKVPPKHLRDGDFPGKSTFCKFMHDFLLEFKDHPSMMEDTYSGFCVDLLAPETLADSVAEPHGRIHGYVKSGSFGFESELVDVRDSNKRKKREATDCELLPFFFLLDFEPGEDSAILLTEQFGNYGVRSAFLDRLQRYVDLRMPPGHKVETSTIVNEESVKQMLNQKVRALRFHFSRVPADVADDLGKDEHIVKNGVMELKIRAKSGHFPNFNWDSLSSKRQTGVTIGDVTSDEMKVDIEDEGKTKTVNIGNLGSFHMSFPVEDREDVQRNGHPPLDRMLTEAEDAVGICRKVLGWKKKPDPV